MWNNQKTNNGTTEEQQENTDNNDNNIYLFLFNKYKAKIEGKKFYERVSILSQLSNEIDYQVLSSDEQDTLFNELMGGI